MSRSVEQRLAVERAIITELVRLALQRGWEIPFVNDGEEQVKIVPGNLAGVVDQVLDIVFSVDESLIFFRKSFGNRRVYHQAFIVLGNDGWDCICDHSLNSEHEGDDFEALMEEVNTFSEKFQ